MILQYHLFCEQEGLLGALQNIINDTLELLVGFDGYERYGGFELLVGFDGYVG